MFNTITLAATLALLTGYRTTPSAPDEPAQLPEALRAAEGALAVQDVHPLLTLRNIRLAAPQLSEAEFFTWLERARVTAATKVVSAFAERKKLVGAAKSILQDAPLTNRSGEYRNKIIRQGRFVGLALSVRNTVRDVAVRIAAVGTQLTEANPDFTLYLFHSSNPEEPVATYPLPRRSRVYWEWTPLSIALPASSGGEWRLGYYENELLGQAIRLDQDLTLRPGQCCGNDYTYYDRWVPYVAVRAFSQDVESGQLTYPTDTNWGLNLQLTAACDLTDFLTRHAATFTGAVRLQLAVDLLQVMAFSTRDNGNSYKTDALALLELNNRTGGQAGLLTQLEQALQALDVDLSGLSKPCLPCTPQPGRIRHTTI